MGIKFFSINRIYDDLYVANRHPDDLISNGAFQDPKLIEKTPSPIDLTVASFAKLFADGKVEEQADFMAAHGFVGRVEIDKMLSQANDVRASHVSLLGNPNGVRLMTVRTAGSLLRLYSYAILLEHGSFALQIEAVQLKKGEWSLSRLEGGLMPFP